MRGDTCAGHAPARRDQRQQTRRSRQRGGIPCQHVIDQDTHRNHEDPAGANHRPQRRNQAAVDLAYVMPARIAVDLGIDRRVIEQCGGQNGEQDFTVGDAGELHHEEHHRAHHRRQQGAAGRGHSFHRGGVTSGVTGPFHHRNGNRAGGHHVGGRAAGNHAEQPTGGNSHLGRATCGTTGQQGGQIEEELTAAALLEKLAESDKQEGIDRGHLYRRREQPPVMRRDHQPLQQELPLQAAMAEEARQVPPEQAIGDHQPHHHGDAWPDTTAQQFQREEQVQPRHGQIQGLEVTQAADPVVITAHLRN